MAAYTQAQLDALRSSYAAGVTRVSYDGKSTEFRSLSEMKQIIDEIASELEGARRRRRFLTKTSGDKGL